MSNQKIIQSLVTNTIIDTYNINKFFEDYVLQKEYFPYQFDGWKEKNFYGLTNNKGEAIYPKSSVISFTDNATGVNFRNLIFVNDAFEEMKKYHLSFLRGNRLAVNQSIYVELNIKNAYQDIDELYLDYFNKIFSIFSNTFLIDERKDSIKDFNSFIKQFAYYIKLISKYTPINRSTFIQSPICPPTINGLIFDFATGLDFANTKDKADNYISDPNFSVFLDSAKRFGFYVDRNAPWRIVADLNSPSMKKYYALYNFSTVDDVLNKCYHVAYKSDLEFLKNILIAFWNSLSSIIGTTSIQKEQINCKNLFAEVSTLQQLDIKIFDKIFGEDWIIRLYLFIKIYENNISISQNKFEILYLEAIKLNTYVSQEVAAEFVNIKINELTTKNKIVQLTSPEEMVKMLVAQQRTPISEGVNF